MASAWPVNLARLNASRTNVYCQPGANCRFERCLGDCDRTVAPLMTLVGERNAREFLRVSSSNVQLFLMATAPLGIVSLMISMIRLSRPPILWRLTGRQADPKSEALVELAPLSVAPATNVHTRHALVIKPNEQRDEGKLVDCERNGEACIMHAT